MSKAIRKSRFVFLLHLRIGLSRSAYNKYLVKKCVNR